MVHQHNNFLSIFCGAVVGIAKAVMSSNVEISGVEIFKVILFGALGALSGLVIKDLYVALKKKLKK